MYYLVSIKLWPNKNLSFILSFMCMKRKKTTTICGMCSPACLELRWKGLHRTVILKLQEIAYVVKVYRDVRKLHFQTHTFPYMLLKVWLLVL